MLTASQRHQFETEGYTTAPDFFDAREVAAMQAELERLHREGKLNNVATDGDGTTPSKHAANLQICPMTPHSRLIRSLKYADKVVSAVSALVGDPVVFKLDQLFYKPAHHGAGTNWHQDNAYWHQSHPTKGVGMWTAVHAATVANGTMHIVPGSHKQLEEHVRDPGSNHHIYAPKVRDEDALAIELPAGGVLFFNFGILHSTRANRTSSGRAGLALHFMNADYANAKFFENDNTARITGPAATGGMAEYGELVAGTWDAEVERMLVQPVR